MVNILNQNTKQLLFRCLMIGGDAQSVFINKERTWLDVTTLKQLTKTLMQVKITLRHFLQLIFPSQPYGKKLTLR